MLTTLPRPAQHARARAAAPAAVGADVRTSGSTRSATALLGSTRDAAGEALIGWGDRVAQRTLCRHFGPDHAELGNLKVLASAQPHRLGGR